MEVNVGGAFLYTREVLPVMLARGRAAVVNVASISGLVGFRNQSRCGMSKGATVQLTRQVAIEYASRGIRCNTRLHSNRRDAALGEGPRAAHSEAASVGSLPVTRLVALLGRTRSGPFGFCSRTRRAS